MTKARVNCSLHPTISAEHGAGQVLRYSGFKQVEILKSPDGVSNSANQL